MDLPAVRRVMTEYTLAWAVLFLLRGAIYAVLIAAGQGRPARGRVDRYGVCRRVALLLFLGYRYMPRRLEQLGAPQPAARAACLSAR